MIDTPDSRDHELRKFFLAAIFIVVALTALMTWLFHVSVVITVEKQKQKIEKQLDAEYVKGYEAALDCRAMLSAPACEVVLEKAGQ